MSDPTIPPRLSSSSAAAATRATQRDPGLLGLGSLATLVATTLASLSHLIDPYRPFLRAFVVARPWLLTLVRMCKFVYGLATNTSEVYRLCAREVDKQRAQAQGAAPGTVSAECIAEIDASILYSKQLSIERRALESPSCGLEQVTHMILLKKRFPTPVSSSPANSNADAAAGVTATPAAHILFSALSVIHESHRLVAQVNARVATKYDRANKAHERQLLLLWSLLHPPHTNDPSPPGPKSDRWTEIGFQGADPSTDFRGMGMYGLDDLVYLAQHHPRLAQYILHLSHDPIAWFSLAIVGINLSAYVVSLLRTRRLQWVMYKYTPSRATLHEVYCWVWVRFIQHWTNDPDGGVVEDRKAPLTIMDFEAEFTKVRRRCEEELVLRAVDLVNIVGAYDVPGVGSEGWVSGRRQKNRGDKKVD